MTFQNIDNLEVLKSRTQVIEGTLVAEKVFPRDLSKSSLAVTVRSRQVSTEVRLAIE